MRSATTSKTVYYLRARQNGKPFDLEAKLKAARRKRRTVAKTEIELGMGDVLRIQHYQEKSGGLRMHIARYEPGVRASILQPKANAPQDDEGYQAPPSGKEFKDGDAFVIIKDSHVLFCQHRLSKEKTSLYLSMLLRDTKILRKNENFDLTPASNLDKLKLIQTHGVKQIHLSANAFMLSLPKKKHYGWLQRAASGVVREFRALIEKDDTPDQQSALEDLLVNVAIRLDGNTRALASSQDLIEQLGEQLLADDENTVGQYIIETQDGQRITAEAIRIQEKVHLDRSENTVNHLSAWQAMDEMIIQLDVDGLLEA